MPHRSTGGQPRRSRRSSTGARFQPGAISPRPSAATPGARLRELAVALERDDDSAHAVALREDDLLDLAALECVDHAVELTHRVTDAGELGVGDADTVCWFGHVRRSVGCASDRAATQTSWN